MNINHRSKGFPMIRLYAFLLALLLPGLCLPGDAYASALKKVAGVGLSGKPQDTKPVASDGLNKQRVAAQSDEGIGISVMCNEIGEDSYNEYGGVYLSNDYIWRWEKPDNIIYEETQTVLNYSSPNKYFGFQIENGAPRIEAIKIYLDPTKRSNASVRSVWANYEDGLFYYIDALAVADYDSNVIYWQNDFKYDLDNIYFYIESGELNVIGFELYSEGRTPDDFFSGLGEYGVAAPRFNPGSCNFYNPLTVEITAGEGCGVYYRTDGSVPTVREEDRYQGPIVISATTTIKAIAADSNGNTSSIVSQKYTCTRHGIGEGYNPSSPGNPGTGEEESLEKRYKLTLVANPVGAGGAYAYNTNLKSGEQTYVSTNNNSGYDFKNWTIEGEVVSTEPEFYYVMPDYDVTIVANYVYNPKSPGNPSPEEQKVKHPVTVRAIPSVAASMSPSGAFDMEENSSREIYASINKGWKLTGWTINGENQGTKDNWIYVTMGEKALDIAAYFTYQPTSPSNPAANYYNPSTGQMIIDDFTSGRLYDAIVGLVGYNYEDVSSLIVKGRMSSDDMGCLRNLTNAGTVDLSRTGELTEVPAYSFRSMGVSSILLPSTVTTMGYRVFQNCDNLTSITLYAKLPPVCDGNTFYQFNNKENCMVYVPRESLELYQNAEPWKDFTILPILNDAHVLQVNLPADASDGRYKHHSIELVNLSSGVRQKYVITDRLVYTFNGLQKDEQYTAYLYSQSGFEIGRIDDIVIPDTDIEVTFDDLKTLHTVFAKVLDKDGADVTGQVSVEWLKPLEDGSTSYLRKATSVSEIPEGESLLCRIGLDSKLGTVYVNPEDVEFAVKDADNTYTVTLVPFRTISLSGLVVDGDGSALSGASVSASQTLNGKYAKTYTAKTDRKGEWSLSVQDAPLTALTFAASECVNVVDTIGAFAQEVAAFDYGMTAMKSIVGARVSYGFTYHAAGEEEVETYYPDYQNVAISVFNETQNRAHNEVSVQYPLLAVLDENINAGDVLKLTATSKTGAFNPIAETVTVGDDQRAEVTFDIVGKGGITASFEMTENPAVTAMLYSEKGELVKKQAYSEAKTSFTGLEDGGYTLVSMGQSDLMNSILRLSNFAEIGLKEGKDYVVNSVKVVSGKLTEVKNEEIPAFDESVFYYTNSSTNFSSNKSSITTGNYLTLRASIDFKGVYKNNISNVALVVDLPEECDFVEQSVIQGPNLLPYTFDDNRLTVQLGDNYQNQTRFCVVPTAGGSFNASASIVFDYNGKSITQPIGATNSVIKDIEINVPTLIARSDFIVSGTAPSTSQINVIVDGELVGIGTSDKFGHWSVDCILPNCQNKSLHDVHAEIINSDGISMRSASYEMKYDSHSIVPRNVTMTFYNGWLKRNVEVDFNFEKNIIEPSSYMFYTTTDLTFLADFTDNSPEKLSFVILHLYTPDNRVLNVPCSYDETNGKWYASVNCGFNNLPVNMSISYSTIGTNLMDRANIDEINNATIEEFDTQKSYSKEISEIFSKDFSIEFDKSTTDEILSILESGIFDAERLNELNDEILDSLGDDLDDSSMTIEELDTLYESELTDYTKWVEELRASVYSEMSILGVMPPEAYDIDVDGEISGISSKGTMYKREYLTVIDETSLINDGFLCFEDDLGYKIYMKCSDGEIITIDAKDNSKVSFSPSQLSASLMRPALFKISLDDEFDSSCFDLINDLTKQLKNQVDELNGYVDQPQTLYEKIKGCLEVVNVIIEAAQCAYSNTYEYVKNKSLNLFDRQIKDINGKIATQQKLIAGYVAENKLLNKDIIQLRKETASLETELKRISQLLTDPSLSAEEIAEYNSALNNIENNARQNHNLEAEKIAKYKANTKKIESCNSKIADFDVKKMKVNKAKTDFLEKMNKLPGGKLASDSKLGKWMRIGGKLAGGLGVLVEIICFFEDAETIFKEGSEWAQLLGFLLKKLPCNDDSDQLWALIGSACIDSVDLLAGSVEVIVGEAFAIAVDIFSLFQPEATLGLWLLSGIPNGIANVINVCYIQNHLVGKRGDYYVRSMKLKCNPKDKWPWEPWWDDHKPSNWDWWGKKPWKRPEPPFTKPTNPIHDPSGYVYEAVPANRVEGVQATIYYKETKEDMYGDPYEEIILWNAEEYAQKNPLFTDENGMYQWDVPQGLWQVKFEKDGYATAYSEWLPVPPPQLEVNIGIVQNKQPEVTEARAYEDGVEVQFDKYMDPSTLNTSNIYVTANGEKLNGEISMVDSELADEYASEEDASATRYASRVRFTPVEKLSTTTGEIRLTVSRNVLSYAGIPMTETFSQTLDVEKEVKAIYADDVKVLYGGEKEVTIHAIPFEAAVGRTLRISSSSDLIASIDKTEAVLDEEGKATVTVKGDLPGRCQLTFSIEDVTETGDCSIDVVTEIITAEAPQASRASGTAVYRGTKVELTSESKDATIYFTTDGSCPCDENGTRRKYTVPIVINEDTKILAMASVGTGDDDVSETVEFNYTLKRSDIDFQMEEGWTWISHNLDGNVAPSDLSDDEGIRRIVGQTKEVIRDPELGLEGNLTSLLATENYKVQTTAATSRKRLSDIAWNPATPIALQPGWNWVGYPVAQTMTVDEALASTQAEALDVVVGQTGFAQYDGENWTGTLETMTPGAGYMYYSQTGKNLVYNTAIVSKAAAMNTPGIAENSPLAVDIHKYSSVMPTVVTLSNADGLVLDVEDYFVAAFSGSECRGIGKTVGDLVMMNVYGEKEDPITFIVTDAEGEATYANDASLKFSERLVGDLFSPYSIMIGDATGVAELEYGGNVKVYFDGDMLRITGIEAEDVTSVDVFDVKGQKLAHLNSIEPAGVRMPTLSEGIYVVVVNGRGEYTYHKTAK